MQQKVPIRARNADERAAENGGEKKEKTKFANSAFCWALLSSPPAAAAECGAAAAAECGAAVVASCLAATYKVEHLRAFKRLLG